MVENDCLRRAAVAQHADTLSAEVDVMSPAGRMKHLSLEQLDSLYVGEARCDKHADSRHEGSRIRELLLARTHVARLNAPHVRICVPLCFVHGGMETAVGTQVVLVDHAMHVLQNFWLSAM